MEEITMLSRFVKTEFGDLYKKALRDGDAKICALFELAMSLAPLADGDIIPVDGNGRCFLFGGEGDKELVN